MYAFNAFAALTVVLGFLANNVAAYPTGDEIFSREIRFCIGGAIKCEFNNGQHCYDICNAACECPSTQPDGSGATLTGSACAFGPTAENRAKCF